MKKIITFLGMLFFLLCGWLPALQAQTTCYAVWQDDTAGTLSLYNNIVYGNSAGVPPDISINPAYSGAMASNAVDTDPGFTSSTNYLITTGSTATYDKGTISYNRQYTDDIQDIQGYARIQETSVDIGAYEAGNVTRSYPYSAAAATNGSISVMNGSAPVADGAYIPSGTSLTVTATPNSGYALKNITVNGINYSKNPYVFSVTGATAVSASFLVAVATVYEESGSLNVYNNIVYGNTWVATENYASISKSQTGNATNAVDIDPGFTSSTNYLITTGSTATYDKGSMSYNRQYINDAQDIQGYARIQGTSVDIGAYEVGTVAKSYSYTAAAVTNGSISVMNGSTPVADGAYIPSGTSLTVSATPNSGYVFNNIIVNGTNYSTNPYLFTITGAITISASFTEAVAAVYEESGSMNLYNNIVYSNTGVVPGDVSTTKYISVLKDLTGNVTNAVDVDPGFTSVTNYMITTGSTATYNTGTSNYANQYMRDIKGNARIQGASIDRGAYEVGTAIISTFITIASGSSVWSSESAWTGNMVPAAGAAIIVQNDLTIDQDVTVSSLNINAGAKLTLASGKTLTANTFTINSDAAGTGTYVDNGTSNIASANVNQYLSYRTWYLSSPVSGATVSGMDRIKSYNEPTDTWSESVTQMAKGTGYLAVPNAGVSNIVFNGILNTGNQAIPLTHSAGNILKPGFNLIGNPYPSYLDWTAVYANSGNAGIMPTSTMWYRTKDAGVYAFWTVNGASGIGTPTTASQYISPMQAFWVRTITVGGTLSLDNTMRRHAPAINNLLKVRGASDAQAEKNTVNQLLRLQVSNGTNTDEAVIYFNDNASNGFDAYDSPIMSNDDAAIPEIYTTEGDEHLVINGMNNIPLNQEIGLGFVAGSATSFSIRANEVSNLPSDVKVILKDNVTRTETDLTDGIAAYKFSQAAISTDRFNVIFRTAGTVTDLDPEKDQHVTVYCNSKKQITVVCNSALTNNTTVSVYNAVGQQVIGRKLTATTTVLDGSFISGVYVVKVNNSTRKVIVK